MVTLQEIQKSVSKVAETYPIKTCYLFGSYARGEATEASDVDLIIETTEDISYFTLVRMQTEIAKILHVPVDLKTRGALLQNPRFHNHIQQDLTKIFSKK